MADSSDIIAMLISDFFKRNFIKRKKSAGKKNNRKEIIDGNRDKGVSESNRDKGVREGSSNNKDAVSKGSGSKGSSSKGISDGKRLCLRDEAADGQAWDIFLVKDVIVGRSSSCHICLGDSSVSRSQCRIYYNGEAMIENLSKTNLTQVNGIVLNAPKPLKLGDKVKCGQVTLAVENSNLSNIKDLNNRTMYINV